MHLGYFLVRLVVKSVVQKKQEFDGVTLTAKPYEKSMKMDNHDYEVFHNWGNGFSNFYLLYKTVIFASWFKSNTLCV